MMEEDHSDILQIISDSQSDITSCDFGGNYTLAIGSSDKSVRLLEWKVGLGFVDCSFSPLLCHKYGVTWVRFSPQGTMLASSSVDGTTILWNVKTGTRIHTMVQSTKCSVRRCEFTPDSTKLITAGDDGVFCFWDIVRRTHICKHYLHNDEDSCVQGLAISPDSKYLLTSDSNGLMKLWCLTKLNISILQLLYFSKNVHDGITSCEFSPNFEVADFESFHYRYTFATCGSDGMVKIWHLETKKNLTLSAATEYRMCDIYVSKILKGHENDVLNCRFNVTGTLLASAGLDKTVKLWRVQDGHLLRNFMGHTRYVNCCAFSKTSDVLASGSNDKTVIIWDLNRTYNLNSELNMRCTSCSHFTGVSAMCALAEELVIRQSESEANRLELKQILTTTSCVNSVFFLGDELIAAAGGDKTISIWRKKPNECLFTLENVLEGHTYNINQIEASRCGTKLISCAVNGAIIIWDLQTGLNYEMRIPDCVNSIRSCRFSPNSEFIAAGGDDQKVFLWDAKNLEFVKILQEHKDAVTSVTFSSDSKLVASTCSAGALKIYSLETDKYYAVKDNVHDLGATCCDFSPQKRVAIGKGVLLNEYTLATCGNDSYIQIWKVKINEIALWRKLSGHGGSVTYVRFASNIPYLVASCGSDYTVRLWNVDNGTCVHVFDYHRNIVTTCAFSQESSFLASGSLDKKIVIWSLPEENCFEKTILSYKSRKSVEHWSNCEVVEWLSELGFRKIIHKVKNTPLNGQHILGMKISDLIDKLEMDNEDDKKFLGLHIYWLRKETKGNSACARGQPDAPHQFLCPITHEIMIDPVVCSDGFTYERGAIIEWLLCGKCTSPMTNEPFTDLKFIPNIVLRTNILKYLYGEEIRD